MGEVTSRRLARSARSGFTLVELLAVMAILGVLLGMSAAMVSKMGRSYRFASSVASAGTVLRAARNHALARQSLSAVYVTKSADGVELTALGQKPVACWHLEGTGNETSGGFTLAIGGASDTGKFGNAAYLRKGQVLAGGAAKDYGLADGVAVSAWFYGLPDGALQRTLFDVGRSLVVTWESDGSIAASVGSTTARTRPAVMTPERWVKVEVVYDRVHLAVTVDGCLFAQIALTDELMVGELPFRVGDPRQAFDGLVDEVALNTFVRGEVARLPLDVVWVGGPSRVQFDRAGALDAAVHGSGVELWFHSEERAEWRLVAVDPIGVVTVTRHDAGPPPPKPKPVPPVTGGPKTDK